MELNLQGKVALVTGASRGIGKAIAFRLAQEGCRLVICARTEEDILNARDEIQAATGAEVLAITLDVTDRAAASELVAAARSVYGQVDILVSNAGGNRRKPFMETTDGDWDDLVELNLLSGLRLAREVIPSMKEAGSGAIVFIGSLFGREAGGTTLSIYNATKSALMSAAKIMALELAPEGIRINTVAPGSIRYPGGSWDKRVQADPDAMAEFVKANLPIGRFGTVDEVADTVAYLVSPRASLITGACIAVDGGQSRSLI
jgi:3-oxoacyl-[acyl-carrier protein] reductase